MFSYYFNFNINRSIQECIPVGYVPPASMAISKGGGVSGVCVSRGVCVCPGVKSVCVSRVCGVCVCVSRGCTPPDPEADIHSAQLHVGIHTPALLHAGIRTPPWTDTCKKIPFLQLLLRAVSI